MPDISLTHLLAMTDDVGLLQHATLDAPNPEFGYCTDDNARAMMLLTQMMAASPSDSRLPMLIGRYFRFVQAAFIPEARSFRNLLDVSGKWADEAGPGDAAGRSLWALGTLVGQSPNGPMRTAAREMFKRALPLAEDWSDLRPIANAILGAWVFLKREDTREVRQTLRLLVDRLVRGFDDWQEPGWSWPEPMMTYENARLPHAILVAGSTLDDPQLTEKGLASLLWLTRIQTVDGRFSPVGNDGWYARGGVPARFDQQPLEAEATVSATASAFKLTRDDCWLNPSQRAFEWFLGANAAAASLGNVETGGCCDGLGRDGINQNQGAESTITWLSSQLQIKTLAPELSQRASSETR